MYSECDSNKSGGKGNHRCYNHARECYFINGKDVLGQCKANILRKVNNKGNVCTHYKDFNRIRPAYELCRNNKIKTREDCSVAYDFCMWNPKGGIFEKKPSVTNNVCTHHKS